MEEVFIIYDDMDYDVGTFKIKPSVSSGGHNGIKSIIEYLGKDNFKRIRIGISKPKGNTINYVLGRFSKSEMSLIEDVLQIVKKVIEDYNVLDFDKLMSKYN